MERSKPVLVAAGGIAGAGVRWAVLHAFDGAGPVLAVNVVGCLLLGMVVRGALRSTDGRRLLVGVGFCGALTTFSTLAVDAARHLDDGAALDAAALLFASLVLGGSALALGAATGRGRA